MTLDCFHIFQIPNGSSTMSYGNFAFDVALTTLSASYLLASPQRFTSTSERTWLFLSLSHLGTSIRLSRWHFLYENTFAFWFFPLLHFELRLFLCFRGAAHVIVFDWFVLIYPLESYDCD